MLNCRIGQRGALLTEDRAEHECTSQKLDRSHHRIGPRLENFGDRITEKHQILRFYLQVLANDVVHCLLGVEVIRTLRDQHRLVAEIWLDESVGRTRIELPLRAFEDDAEKLRIAHEKQASAMETQVSGKMPAYVVRQKHLEFENLSIAEASSEEFALLENQTSDS